MAKTGRPRKEINWALIENLVQFGCKENYIAMELAKDNGIARPDKKHIANYGRTLLRRIHEKYGMTFVEYSAFYKNKLKTVAWKAYLDESLNKRNPRLIKDLMDRLDGKPQDSLKLSGDQANPIKTENKIIVEFVDSEEDKKENE